MVSNNKNGPVKFSSVREFFFQIVQSSLFISAVLISVILLPSHSLCFPLLHLLSPHYSATSVCDPIETSLLFINTHEGIY